MKKWFWVLTAVFITAICTSCQESVKVPDIVTASESNASVSFNGTEYQCFITYVNGSTASVEINYPESLRGLTFRRADGKQTVSLGNLICKSDSFVFGENCVSAEIIRVFDSVKKDNMNFISADDEGVYEFSGKNKNFDLKLFTDKEGNVIKIKTDRINIEIEN